MYYMGVQIPMGRGNFEGRKGSPLESIATLCRELCKSGWTDWDAVWDLDSGGFKEALLGGVHIGATWRILLNHPCVAAILPVVKLLWPLVKISMLCILMSLTVSHSLYVKMLVHGQVTIIFVVSVGLFVCLFVCLCRVFLSCLWSDFDQTWTYVNVWV